MDPVTTLLAGMQESDLSQADFARGLGIHRSMLNHITQRRRRPTLELAVRIERFTRRRNVWRGKVVRAVDWVPLEESAAAA